MGFPERQREWEAPSKEPFSSNRRYKPADIGWWHLLLWSAIQCHLSHASSRLRAHMTPPPTRLPFCRRKTAQKIVENCRVREQPHMSVLHIDRDGFVDQQSWPFSALDCKSAHDRTAFDSPPQLNTHYGAFQSLSVTAPTSGETRRNLLMSAAECDADNWNVSDRLKVCSAGKEDFQLIE